MRPNTGQILELLKRFESRNVTYIDPQGDWPIVWERARGTEVWDADGKKYVDLTAAFGVAAAGHGNRAVVRAGRAQMDRLLHAMGDVHPHRWKARLAERLSQLTYERWSRERTSGKTIFCNSGFEAVEAALKTAFLATGKPGVIAFSGAYHGLGYGALNATHRAFFRSLFRLQLAEFASFVPFPSSEKELASVEKQIGAIVRRKKIGAILAEPIQGRGGIRIPPAGFLPLLRRVADRENAVLILDEIFTGFGRTGKWFACETGGIVPDLICLGKALTGGFPLSACVGKAEVMDCAWPASTGEALHTSTFLGHPVGCAMALAQIAEIKKRNLVDASDALGRELVALLGHLKAPGLNLEVRGRGLMVGLELRTRGGKPATEFALAAIKKMLTRGFILLPEGEFANVISFTPPLVISRGQLEEAVGALQKILRQAGGKGI